MKCPICKHFYERIMSHFKTQHPEKYEEECQKATEMFESGLTLRQIGASSDTFWTFNSSLAQVVKSRTELDTKKERRKRASKTMKAGYAQKLYKIGNRGRPKMTITTPTDQPYDDTNSTNPWLIKCHGDPIIGPEGKPLTPKYIWGKQGKDRIDLMEWVFNYYRSRGYPVFSLSDAALKKGFKKLQAKDPSDVMENGYIKNSNTVGLDCAKHFTAELFLATKGAGKSKSCIEAFNDDELFKKVLKNRMGWKSSSEDGEERPYVFGINDKMINQGFRSSMVGHSTSHFKPLIAKFIYDRYNVKKTIDYSSGWGARAMAALSLGIEYYGIDPLTHEKINKIIKHFGGIGRCVGEGSEVLDYSVFPDVDMCFSCPSYFNLEIYSEDNTQSTRFDQYNDWLKKYWAETVKKCMPKCKYFSFIAVENVRKHELLKDMCEECESAGMKLIEKIPIKVAKSHLSGKKQSKQTSKKTEQLVVYERI